MFSNRRAQSVVEYAIFLVAVIGALVVMSAYIKRGVQGNWHRNTADLFPELFVATGSKKTKEVPRLNISVSNYSLGLNETGRGTFSKRPAAWIGGGWSIWTPPER